jgi:hypothetical protein
MLILPGKDDIIMARGPVTGVWRVAEFTGRVAREFSPPGHQLFESVNINKFWFARPHFEKYVKNPNMSVISWMLESSLFPQCTDPDKKPLYFWCHCVISLKQRAPGRKEEIKKNLSLSKFFFFNSLNA